jgi:hypothetical protein
MRIPTPAELPPRTQTHGKPLVKMNMRVTPGLQKGFKQFAEEHDVAMSALLEYTLKNAYPALRKQVNAINKEYYRGKRTTNRQGRGDTE